MDESLQNLVLQLKSLRDQPINYMRPVTLVLTGEIRHRIHVEGKRSDGSDIGTYRNSYLAYREKYHNRTSSTRMVWSLTRQMEQDFVPIADGNTYGLGFNNSFNLQKAGWLDTGPRYVYLLTSAEEQLAIDTINDYINGIFG